MNRLRLLAMRLRAMFAKPEMDRALDEELQSHFDMLVEQNIGRGMPPEEARRAARLELGGADQIKESVHDQSGLPLLESLWQDVRYGARMLRKSPGFTTVAVLTLALGIAANVSIFELVDALLLQSVPAKNPTHLVRIKGEYSYPEYRYLREHAQTLEEITAHYSTAPFYVTVNNDSSEVQGAVVSSDYFRVLGLQPWLGRFFIPEEDSVPDRDAVAVLSYSFWQRMYGGEPAILGKTLGINGRRFTVIGIMPPDFQGVIIADTPNEIWIPAAMIKTGYRWCNAFEPGCSTLELMARLVPGRSIAEAESEVSTLLRQLRSVTAGLDERQRIVVTSDAEIWFGRDYLILLLRLLTVTAGILLLVVCANLGGLLIARGTARETEIAMRLTLGAGRNRIARQLLTEGLLLAIVGGALGVAISTWISKTLIAFYSADGEGYQHFFAVRPDLKILFYSIAVTAGTGILFGILPAWQGSRVNLNEALKRSGTGSLRRGRSRVSLVTVQIAFSLSLMVAAGLLARSGANIEAGYNMDVHHVLGLRLRPLLLQYSPARAQAFEREVVRRLRELPGTESVSLSKGVGPVWGSLGGEARLALLGHVYPKPADEPVIHQKEVAEDYFTTLRIPFVAGRDFNGNDRSESPRVAIVNETLARTISQSKSSPLGRTIILDDAPYQIVGLVKDAQLRSALEAPIPVAYTAYWQNEQEVDARMCIRVAGDPAAFLPAIRKTIANVDPDVPVTETLPLIDQVRGAFVEARVAATVIAAAAGLALFLCAIGLYGVIAYDVRRRTREIGLRMALGGDPGRVLGFFLRQAMLLVVIGDAAGIVVALSASRLLRAYLIGIGPFDFATLCGAVSVLFVVALLASYLPARNASRVDPMVALRYE